VAAVVETARGARDVEVIRQAQEEERVLLTEDKDFGQLVYAGAKGRTGVILLRFPAPARRQAASAVLDLVGRIPERLPTSFVVLEPGRARVSSIPE
jgi:predicted nuclease of predicted toxin-antitoxin system